MSDSSEQYPAVVLGVGITALGVMRGLSKYGIKCYAADKGIDFVRYSRFYRKPVGVDPLLGVDDLPRFLESIDLDEAVLMPCGDQWSRAVLDLDDGLSQRFPCSIPSRKVWNMLTDKGLLAEFLEENNVPHPRSIDLSDEGDLKQVESLFPGKWFIKPRDSEKFFRHYWVKAYEVTTLEELDDLARKLFHDGHTFILQEYIEGPPSNHIFIDGFIDRHGNVRTVFARQRLRMYPPLFGNSSYMVTIEKSRARTEIDLILGALNAASYRGVFSAEFKRKDGEGTPALLEINTRPWWYIWFAERCGLSIARMAYLDALACDVPSQEDYSVNTFMVYPFNDAFACWAAVKSGKLSIFRCIGDWFKAKQAVFWIVDPLPSIVWFLREIYRTVARRFARGKIQRPAPGRPKPRVR